MISFGKCFPVHRSVLRSSFGVLAEIVLSSIARTAYETYELCWTLIFPGVSYAAPAQR